MTRKSSSGRYARGKLREARAHPVGRPAARRLRRDADRAQNGAGAAERRRPRLAGGGKADPGLAAHRPAMAVRIGRRRGRIGAGLSRARSEEHTSELQSLMRISYAVFCLTKQKTLTPTAYTL